MGLAPFDEHPGNVGALEQASTGLAAEASQALDQWSMTFNAFFPAVANWDGMAAPELRAAPRPVRERVFELSESLSWASVAVEYWAKQINTFNQRVAQIKAQMAAALLSIGHAAREAATDHHPMSPEQVATQQAAARADAEREWHEAYESLIIDGRQTFARMLRNGPTPANVAAAREVGLIPPGQPWNPFLPMYQAAHGMPPGGQPIWPFGYNCSTGNDLLDNAIKAAGQSTSVINAAQNGFLNGLQDLATETGQNAALNHIAHETDTCIPTPPPAPPKPPDGGGGGLPLVGPVVDAVGDAGQFVIDHPVEVGTVVAGTAVAAGGAVTGQPEIVVAGGALMEGGAAGR